MRFQVPQFIEVEDRIFGPLTLKQFIYLLGAAGIVFIAYTFLKSLLWTALVSLPFIALALALAFYKVNNRPFINVVESAFNYYIGNKLYIWKKVEKPIVSKAGESTAQQASDFYVPKLSDSKLKDLTWSLDIKQSQNPAQSQSGRQNF